MGFVYNLATALVALGATLAWWFVFLYRRHDWRRYEEGRHVMQFTLMVAIILTLATETRIFGPYPGIQLVAVALYSWLVWLLLSRIRLMLRANRRQRDEAR